MTDQAHRREGRDTASRLDAVSLDRLFWPESIAIVGASTNPEAPGAKLLDVLLQYRFDGRLYAINPRGGEVGNGITAYTDLELLPEIPQLCLVVVGADRVFGVLDTCRRLGVPAVVVYSAETADHPLTRDGFLQITHDSTTRVFGPNSVGLLNVARGMAATWSPAIDVSRGGTPPADGPVAIIAQSGGLGFGLLSESTRRGLGVRYVASTGNEADIGCAEVARYALADASLTTVLMFIEGLHTPLELVDLGRAARDAAKSVVVVKVGRSVAGQEASALHTAHLAGSDVAYDAVFQEYGITRAEDTEEMIDYAMALARCPVMTGTGIGIATYSGGAGVWVADACEAVGFEVPPIHQEHQAVWQEQLGTLGSVRNPIDLTGPKMSPTALTDAAERLADDPSINAVVVITPTVGNADGGRGTMDDASRLANELFRLQTRSGKPVVLFTYTGATAAWVQDLASAGVAWYTSPVRLAKALRCLLDAGRSAAQWRSRSTLDPRASPPTHLEPLPGHRAVLLEHEVKAWLHSHGLPTSREVLVQTSAQAAEAARRLGSPVVLKAQATGVIHKSALGLVALGVSPEHVETTFQELWSRSIDATGALPDGVLVQEMVPAGVELIVGTISDPDFGPLVMVGAGGSAVEVLGDRAFRLAPIDADEAMNVIVGLRIYQAAVNAGRSGDFEWTALAQLVAYVSTLAWEYRDELAGLELNPVVILPQRRGIVVVDASGERRGALDD